MTVHPFIQGKEATLDKVERTVALVFSLRNINLNGTALFIIVIVALIQHIMAAHSSYAHYGNAK